MSENRKLTDMVLLEVHRQLQEHFFEEAIACKSEEVQYLEKMVLDEISTYIQSGVYEIIQVFMDEKQAMKK